MNEKGSSATPSERLSEAQLKRLVDQLRTEAGRTGIGGSAITYLPERGVFRLSWPRQESGPGEDSVEIPATEQWVAELTRTLKRLARTGP